MSGSESYSYDAPSSYNFGSTLEEDDTNADLWFDQLADAENIPPDDNKSTDQDIHIVHDSKADENCSEGDVQKPQAPLNIVGSMEAWRAASRKPDTPGASAGPAQRRSIRRLSGKERTKQLAKIRAERRSVKTAPPDDHPPIKKQKLTTSKSNLSNTTVSSDASMCSPKPKARLTMPSTPTVLKRKTFPVKGKTSEEQELEKMQQLQQEVVEQRKKNEESLKAAIAGTGQPVKKTGGQVTKPVDFHFRTDDRLKRHPEEATGDQYKEVDFTAALRKHPSSPARGPKGGHTVPKPFNLSQANKRKHEELDSGGGFVSTAEQVLAFYKRTPARYHLRSRQRDLEGPSPVKQMKPKLTNPKTPLLQTKQRHRPAMCKSSQELEAEELEKLQQFKFKARELDPRILEGGPVPLKKPPVKEPTKAIGFDLEIEKRLQQREKKDEEEETYTFHSKPCPSKILADVVGVPEKKLLPVTVPKSPAFALKNRVKVQEEEEEEEELSIIKANPMPHFGVPFKPRLEEQRQVEVCPFSFCDRDRERMLQKEKKLEELRNGEVPKFKAQPLPQFDHISLPEKKVKMPTQQEPFQLEIDKRGASKIQRWKQQIKEELKQQKEMSTFKARPNTVTHQEPFVPKKESKLLTESLSGSIVHEGFELATERRARERQEFEKRLADLETQKCLMEEEERQRQEEGEREERTRLRHELVHKAQPVRKYRPVEVKTSDMPLTIPKSPNFSDRFKC